MTATATHTARDVADWLRDLPNIRDVRPCRVTIGKSTWEGASYSQVFQWQQGMDGVQQGEHKAGEEYYVRHIYLLGKAPNTGRAGQCFPYEGKDWFVAGYYDGPNPEAIAPVESQIKHHPFGKMFMLSPWDAPGKIDEYERSPYRRTNMTVTFED